jgi:hypothetical protein
MNPILIRSSPQKSKAQQKTTNEATQISLPQVK